MWITEQGARLVRIGREFLLQEQNQALRDENQGLRDERDRLRTALEWYAKPQNTDDGERARQALRSPVVSP